MQDLGEVRSVRGRALCGAPAHDHAIIVAALRAAPADDQRHWRKAVDPDDAGGRRAEIDHPSVHERAAIVDPYRHRPAVAVVDDGHHGAERQRAVRRRHRGGVHVLAAGRVAVTVHRGETRSLVAVLGMRDRH